jgi:GntR family transcriptional regulator
MPLTISVDRRSNVSAYQQIVEQVCAAVARGSLRKGDLLPSARSLAARLRVNPSTVARAWRELADAGVVEARPGDGMFVSQRSVVHSAGARARRMEQAVTSFVADAFMLGFAGDQMLERITAAVRPPCEAKEERLLPKRGPL